jgi:ABC-2 type transport system ATP-binding protein
MKAIETVKLTKFYGNNRGIENLDLSVEKGDFFGFIGPNGAGKSTTIRTLLGLIAPTSGHAEILGKDIEKDRLELLSRIGYLPSEAIFYNGMKVSDIISLSAKLRKQDCSAEAKALCHRLELDVTRKINELSLGNRKKVGIVCALQHRPELYILDEPTSGLDPLMQREFYTIMKERNQEGATVFVSSHILSEVERYCNHAAVIKKGELIISESMDRISHSDTKKIILRGVDSLPQCDSIRDIQRDGDCTKFLYSGKAEDLIKMLSGIRFTDISITDPDLEEIFMHYYTREDEQK